MSSFELGGMNLRRHLLEAVLAFWERHGIDRRHGGFLTLLNRDGTAFGQGEKYLVMQTRMIYSFSTGYMLSRDEKHLRLAEQGVEFLLRHFWDSENEGWFYSTTREGRPIERAKFPYGHAFAVYALGEYHRAAGDREALKKAVETYDLMERRAWDRQYGGYFWFHDGNWAVRDQFKRSDIVMHTVEGLSSLYAATRDARYAEALVNHGNLVAGPMIDRAHRCLREAFLPDWQENLEQTKGLVSPGHNLEAAWFLWALDGILGRKAYSPVAEQLLNFALNCGWDREHGGFYAMVSPEGVPMLVEKVWWVQTEGIGALSMAYRLTGEERYAELLRSLLGFCSKHLYDEKYGEWYLSVEADGSEKDPRKGSDWKAAYHIVQALKHAYMNLSPDKPISYLP